MVDAFTDNAWAGSLVVVLSAVVAYVLVRYVAFPIVYRLVHRTENTWDDVLLNRRVLLRASMLAPAIVLRAALPLIDGLSESSVTVWTGIADAVLILLALVLIMAVARAFNEVYEQLELSVNRPIKGYLQIVVILAWVFGVIAIIARLTGQDVGLILGGLGAVTAVLLLVFKDTILSVVASIQLTGNDMVRVGDWIQIDRMGVDGEVVDIALHTIKVQNWNKTVSTVPTYSLVSQSFINWRAMEEAGGRRIKRSINIDMSTIRFLTDDEVARWSRFQPLASYMEHKQNVIEEWNEDLSPETGLTQDPRRLTNIGTFRAYVSAYLRRQPEIDTTMTFLVRQLEPTPQGLPLQIYVFSSDTRWAWYEGIQADIFDHLLAMVPEFGLEVFQEPAGSDLREGLTRPDR